MSRNIKESEMSGELCTDNRFRIIEDYKNRLVERTNIKSRPDEMAVIDNILFRFWQMRWLYPLPQGRLVLEKVISERISQIDQWGENACNHPFEWMSILSEEVGELCEAVNETCFKHPKQPERGGYDNILKEAIQVASVAIAIAEDMFRLKNHADQEIE